MLLITFNRPVWLPSDRDGCHCWFIICFVCAQTAAVHCVQKQHAVVLMYSGNDDLC